MTTDFAPIYYALASSSCFATASLGFAYYAKKISPQWVNGIKALVAWTGTLLLVTFFIGWTVMEVRPILFFLLSGLLGLGVADLLLLKAFARMGSARTLLLYGFQPLFLGVSGWILFGQQLRAIQFLAIFFFLLCLFTISYERRHEQGHWEWRGLVFAIFGVAIDNVGVLLTRSGFEASPGLSAIQANFVRCSGAMAYFILMAWLFPFGLRKHWTQLTNRDRTSMIGASILGTLMSLAFYLKALQIGNLALIAALGVVVPLISTALECAQKRQWPNQILGLAIVFFVAGFCALLL